MGALHKPWKPADGLLIDEIGSTALAEYFLSARAWSPSLLQQYARCPYRFALRGIHGLHPAEQPAGIQRLDAETRGRIYHEVQFELLRDLAAAQLLPVAPATLEASLERLEAVLRRVTDRAEAELAPCHSADLAVGRAIDPRRPARMAATARSFRCGLDSGILRAQFRLA